MTINAALARALFGAWFALVPIVADADGNTDQLMKGKLDTGRSIEFRIVVDGNPEDIFQLWVNEAATTEFFGIGANIEPHLGGLYEIAFSSPTGERAGTRGTRILRYKPPSELWFEWEMPKYIGHLNTRPLQTWVEIRFETFGSGNQTDIHLLHRGFGQGDDWDQGFDFFLRNWFEVLHHLKTRQEEDASE